MITTINEFRKLAGNIDSDVIPVLTQEVSNATEEKDERTNLEDLLYVGDFEV